MPRLYKMEPEEHEIYRRKVMRVGGSVVTPLPKEIRREVDLGVGDQVDVWVDGEGRIILRKVERVWSGRITRKD